MSAWQPIETAPKDAHCVLLWAEGHDVTAGYWDDDARWDETQGCYVDGNGRWLACETQISTGGTLCDHGPTHWMPLPDPPSETKLMK